MNIQVLSSCVVLLSVSASQSELVLYLGKLSSTEYAARVICNAHTTSWIQSAHTEEEE